MYKNYVNANIRLFLFHKKKEDTHYCYCCELVGRSMSAFMLHAKGHKRSMCNQNKLYYLVFPPLLFYMTNSFYNLIYELVTIQKGLFILYLVLD